MTFYDQLGVPPTAREEEIRRAYRTLCKLLHSDQPTDPGVRSAAELQMRRINAIADTLLDTERRREYDQSITRSESDRHSYLIRKRVGFEGPLVPLLITIFIAVLVSTAAVWFFAGDLIYLQPSSAANQPTDMNSAASRTAVPLVRAASASVDASATPSLDGLWVYDESGIVDSRPVVDTVEHVELRLQARGDTLYGEYIAHYRVPPHTVSPRVAFRFEGHYDPEGEFLWRTADGTRGLVDLRTVNDHSMRVDWRVVRFGPRAVLGAGTTVLTRLQ